MFSRERKKDKLSDRYFGATWFFVELDYTEGTKERKEKNNIILFRTRDLSFLLSYFLFGVIDIKISHYNYI